MVVDWKGHVINLGRKRPKSQLVRIDLAGQCHAHHGAAVKGSRKRDNAAARRVPPRNFYRVFNGFYACRKENRLFARGARCRPIQALGELYIDVVRRDLKTSVTEALKLVFDSCNYLGVIMSGIDERHAGREIDVSSALNVPEFGVSRPVRKHIRFVWRRPAASRYCVCPGVVCSSSRLASKASNTQATRAVLGYHLRLAEEDHRCVRD